MNARFHIGSIVALALIGIGAGAWLWHDRVFLKARSFATTRAPQPPGRSPLPGETRPWIPRDVIPTDTAREKRAAPRSLSLPSSFEPPFRPGETLEFTAHVSKLSNVASLSLVVHPKQQFFGRDAWHVQAFAHTQNPLRMVFILDDQFDSYSDASSLTSLQYEMHLSERGDKVDRAFRMSTRAEPAPSNATAVRVLPGTRDPLGLLEYLRTVDWTKTPFVRCPVFDGQKLYDVQARLESPSISVSVPAGTFPAARIAIRVFLNSAELKDARFALSLANNEARTPLLLEAVLPFADARVELLRLP